MLPTPAGGSGGGPPAPPVVVLAPTSDGTGAPAATVTDIPPFGELRFYVQPEATGSIKLLEGSGELFGVELAVGRPYTLPHGKSGSVASFYGAKVETSGGFESVYLAAPPAGSRPDEDTPVARPVAIHQHLEVRRETTKRALAALPPPPVPPTDAPGDGDVALLPEDAPTGPRVIILGPEDSGKSTLCRTLLAYAARMGWQPTWVDVDLGQGGLTPPGCVAAAPVDRTCLSVEQGFERLAPLAYFTGAVSPSDGKLYSFAVSTLAGAVGEAQRVSAHARASGVIINTMGWVDGAGYALQLAVIAAFRPEVVLVMGQDKLYADLRRDLRGSTDDWASPAVSPSSPLVLKLPRSDGVVTRSSVIRRDARSQRVREYFYGKDGALGPHLTTVPFDDVRLLKLSGVTGDKMTMPVGYRETDAGIRVRAAEVAITADLVSCLLAVSFATTPAEVPTTNVAGFILVKKVDMEARTLEVLFPCSEPLPSKCWIKSNITWTE